MWAIGGNYSFANYWCDVFFIFSPPLMDYHGILIKKNEECRESDLYITTEQKKVLSYNLIMLGSFLPSILFLKFLIWLVPLQPYLYLD